MTFCNFCKSDAHFIRQNAHPNSPIACPMLLASSCDYCGETGHVRSHCTTKKRHDKETAYQNKVSLYMNHAKPINNTKSKKRKISNAFEFLCDSDSDSDDDDHECSSVETESFETNSNTDEICKENPVCVEIEFPIEASSQNVTVRKIRNWAAMMDMDSSDEE